jgi:hypothetical protein
LNAPIIIILITGQAQKSVFVGALHLLGLPTPGLPGTGLPGEDYEAKGVLRLSLRTVSKVEPPFKGRG